MTGPLQYRTDGNASHAHDPARDEPAHHEETEPLADGSVHEPGPSFVANERPTDRLTAMPAWLQSFAAQESANDAAEDSPTPTASTEPSAPSQEDEQRSEAASPDQSLPDWLRDDDDQPQVTPAATASAPESFDATATTAADSFISEDDLPDWLRAFSEEVAETAPSTFDPSARRVTRFVPAAQAMGVRVPPVENVWLSAYERQALGPGATLFALLASNPGGGVEADAQAHTARTSQSSPRSEAGRGGAGASRAGAEIAIDRGDTDGEAASRSSSVRLLLLTLLVVAIVILVSVWQFS